MAKIPPPSLTTSILFNKSSTPESLNKTTVAPTFQEMITSEINNKYLSFKDAEENVYAMLMGKKDGESVIPIVARSVKEMQTMISLVENITGAFKKILETQV